MLTMCYEISINLVVIGSVISFLVLSNRLSSNMRRRMFQINRMIDSVTKLSSTIQCLQSTDIGYGRVESKRIIEDLVLPRSLMIGSIRSNRVNLRIMILRLCSILLFL